MPRAKANTAIVAKVGSKRNFGSSTCDTKDSKDAADTTPSSQGAEVDKEVASSNDYEVAQDGSGRALSCYLMHSCGNTNANKYYILQVLQKKGTSSDSFYMHARYGRVGSTAANTLEPMTQEAAAKAYKKAYGQKTSASKGYKPIAMSLGAGDGTTEAKL